MELQNRGNIKWEVVKIKCIIINNSKLYYIIAENDKEVVLQEYGTKKLLQVTRTKYKDLIKNGVEFEDKNN